MDVFAGNVTSRFLDLSDHLVPVGDKDPDPLFDMAQVGAQVVLQVLDADPLNSLHVAGMVATSSYYVKASRHSEFPCPRIWRCRSLDLRDNAEALLL